MTNPLARARLSAAQSGLADVEAILGVAPPSGPRASENMRSFAFERPRRPANRAGAAGAAIALALLGLAVGAALSSKAPPADRPAAVQTAVPTRQLDIDRTPQPTPAPAAPAPVTLAAPAKVAPSPPPAAARRSAPRPQPDCARPGGRRCSYAAMLDADRTLREAYRRAGRAGVSARELSQFQRSWSHLRPQGARDPDRVVRGYRAMAADLNQLARDRRS